MLSKRTLRPQPCTIPPKIEHANDSQARQARKQTDAPTNTQIDEHRPREQDTSRSEQRPRQIISSEQRCRILRIREWEIYKHALKDEEVGSHQNGDSNEADDPMYTMPSCPSEHEISYWQANDSEESGNESMFRGTHTILLDIWDQILELVDEEAGDTNQACNANDDEAETCLAEVEIIYRRIYEWEDLEEGTTTN